MLIVPFAVEDSGQPPWLAIALALISAAAVVVAAWISLRKPKGTDGAKAEAAAVASQLQISATTSPTVNQNPVINVSQGLDTLAVEELLDKKLKEHWTSESTSRDSAAQLERMEVVLGAQLAEIAKILNGMGKGVPGPETDGEAMFEHSDHVSNMLSTARPVATSSLSDSMVRRPQASGDLSFIEIEAKITDRSLNEQDILSAALDADKRGDRKLAIQISEAALNTGRVDVAIVANLGTFYAEDRRFDDAIHLFEQLHKAGSLPPNALAPYGGSLLSLMRFDEAQPLLEAALDHDPCDYGSKLRLVSALAARGMHGEARALLDELEEVHGSGKAELILPRAMMADEEGKFADAVALYESALQAGSTQPWIMERLAAVAYSAGDVPKSVDAINRLQLLDPNHTLISVLPGLYLQLGNSEAAVKQIEERKVAGVITSTELVASGQILQAEGHRVRALAEYRAASKMDPSNAMAYLGEADILREEGRERDALPLYRKYVPTFAHLAHGWSNYGVCASHQGLHDEAIEAHKRAVKLAPDDGFIHYNLGCALALGGYIDDARSAVLRSFELDSELRAIADSDDDLQTLRPL